MAPAVSTRCIGLFHSSRGGRRRQGFRRRSRGNWRSARSGLGALFANATIPAYVSGHSAFTAAWARVMELVTGHPDLNLRIKMHHLFVEQRELADPVELFYPSFAAAAEASGMSRIWGGIHWPADNE